MNSPEHRLFSNKSDPLARINKMAQSELVKRSNIHVSGLNRRHLDTDKEFNPSPAAEQLSSWKEEFNGRLQHIQEEILLYITQKHISNEELVLLIRNTISELKLSVSELLNTMSQLIKKFIKRSKKMVQNSNQYWQQVVLDLNNQLEYMTRMRAIEADKRNELERENRQLKQQLRVMRLENRPKMEYEGLVHSQREQNASEQVASWENQLRFNSEGFTLLGSPKSHLKQNPGSARSLNRSPQNQSSNSIQSRQQRNEKLNPKTKNQKSIVTKNVKVTPEKVMDKISKGNAINTPEAHKTLKNTKKPQDSYSPNPNKSENLQKITPSQNNDTEATIENSSSNEGNESTAIDPGQILTANDMGEQRLENAHIQQEVCTNLSDSTSKEAMSLDDHNLQESSISSPLHDKNTTNDINEPMTSTSDNNHVELPNTQHTAIYSIHATEEVISSNSEFQTEFSSTTNEKSGNETKIEVNPSEQSRRDRIRERIRQRQLSQQNASDLSTNEEAPNESHTSKIRERIRNRAKNSSNK